MALTVAAFSRLEWNGTEYGPNDCRRRTSTCGIKSSVLDMLSGRDFSRKRFVVESQGTFGHETYEKSRRMAHDRLPSDALL
jgi:hypothetical protein